MLPLDELMLRFEALGDNCEFGLVQRQGGAEPLGLLRFAGFYVPIEQRLDRLIAALGARFDGLGRPATLRVEAAGDPGVREYLIWEDTHDLMYHSFQLEGAVDPEVLRALEAKKLGFLRRKFLDDLAAAAKILVWKSNLAVDEADLRRLLSTLREFGPNTLLWVREADAAHPSGTAEAAGDGLLKGYVDRFAPYDNATDISYQSWFEMCASVHRTHQGIVAAEETPADPPEATPGHSAPNSHPDLEGELYLEVLSRMHAVLRPQSYLEIGSRAGDSLSLAACPSIAIDPAFSLAPTFLGAKPVCGLYQMPSDRFFESFDPQRIFGRAIDFAFLDGMHLAEFLLRDFANTERACRRNSVIAMHDCVPVEAAIARRTAVDFSVSEASRHPHWWTGDVWKTVLLLKRFRPDLRIHAFDAAPTGLVFVTNLDPGSRVLADNYDVMLAEIRALDLESMGITTYIDSLQMMPTTALRTPEDFSQYFWL